MSEFKPHVCLFTASVYTLMLRIHSLQVGQELLSRVYKMSINLCDLSQFDIFSLTSAVRLSLASAAQSRAADLRIT